MTGFIIRRLLGIIPTLLVIYTITFFIMRATPGGPWDAVGDRPLPKAVIESLQAAYGLDKPLHEQWFDYIYKVVTKFDFGPSYRQPGRTVNDIIGDFFPISIQLGLVAMAVAVAAGIPLGIFAALNQNKLGDYLATLFAIVGVSVPTFVIGPVLILILAVWMRLLPTGGWGTPEKLLMPAFVLALEPAALIARYTRASMLEVIRMDYVRTARAKGLRELRVIGTHALRNALIPVITIGGVLVAGIITGSFYVETVFGVPGIGRYFVGAVSNRDYPVLMGTTLLLAFVITVMNFLVDLAYGFIDPRIRYE